MYQSPAAASAPAAPPPPWQCLNDAMNAFEQCRKIAESPFPFAWWVLRATHRTCLVEHISAACCAPAPALLRCTADCVFLVVCVTSNQRHAMGAQHATRRAQFVLVALLLFTATVPLLVLAYVPNVGLAIALSIMTCGTYWAVNEARVIGNGWPWPPHQPGTCSCFQAMATALLPSLVAWLLALIPSACRLPVMLKTPGSTHQVSCTGSSVCRWRTCLGTACTHWPLHWWLPMLCPDAPCSPTHIHMPPPHTHIAVFFLYR